MGSSKEDFIEKYKRIYNSLRTILDTANLVKNELFSTQTAYKLTLEAVIDNENVAFPGITLPYISDTYESFGELILVDLPNLRRDLNNLENLSNSTNVQKYINTLITELSRKIFQCSENPIQTSCFQSSDLDLLLKLITIKEKLNTNEDLLQLMNTVYNEFYNNVRNGIKSKEYKRIRTDIEEIKNSLTDVLPYLVYLVYKIEHFKDLHRDFDVSKKDLLDSLNILLREGIISESTYPKILDRPPRDHIIEITFGGLLPEDHFLIASKHHKIKDICVGGYNRELNILRSFDPFSKKDTFSVLLMGYTGTGKSTLIQKVIKELSDTYDKILFLKTGRAWNFNLLSGFVSTIRSSYKDYGIFLWVSEPENKSRIDDESILRPIEQLLGIRNLYLVIEINYNLPQRVARRLANYTIEIRQLNINEKNRINEIIDAAACNLGYKLDQERKQIIMRAIYSAARNLGGLTADMIAKSIKIAMNYKDNGDISQLENVIRDYLSNYSLPSNYSEETAYFRSKYKNKGTYEYI